jgi:DNA-directed RNA polymerase subunit RPC12/RpoP
MCQCGAKLLLKITKTDGMITQICLTEDPEIRTVKFIEGKRSRRTLRTGSFALAYMYCVKCSRKIQVRTFDTLEEYL